MRQKLGFCTHDNGNGMELMPGYKQSEVGPIPFDWDLLLVSELANVDPENLSASTDPNFSFNYISLEQVDFGNLIGTSREVFRTAPSRARRVVRHDDVLMSTVRPNLKAHLHFRSQVSDAICSTGFAVLRAKPDAADPAYIFAHLFASPLNKQIEKTLAGSNYPAINSRDVRELKIPCPPTLREQGVIAQALSDVDALLATLDQVIAKKRDLKQAAMQQLLTGKTRLPGFGGKWEVKCVSDVCWFQEGPGVRNTQFTSTGVKLLNGTNIFRGRINLDTTGRFISETEAHGAYAHFLAESGDIVIACSGISVEKFHEKVAVVTPAHLPFCMNTSTMRFKPRQERLVRDYFCHFLMGDSFKRQIAPQATGSAQLNFGPSHIEKVELPLPPHAEQTAIAAVLSEMDAELVTLEVRRDKTHSLKQAMMQELLTGKTRLV